MSEVCEDHPKWEHLSKWLTAISGCLAHKPWLSKTTAWVDLKDSSEHHLLNSPQPKASLMDNEHSYAWDALSEKEQRGDANILCAFQRNIMLPRPEHFLILVVA